MGLNYIMTSLVYLIVVLLGSIAPLVYSRCEISFPYTSPYTAPFYEQYTPSRGCVSNDVKNKDNTNWPLEVHVINLLNSGPNSGDTGPVVTLHIKPQAEKDIHQGPLLFFLYSHQPVTWQVRSERIDNTSTIKFQITKGSNLTAPDTLSWEVKRKGKRPQDSGTLFKRVKKRHPVTSFMEVMSANNIFKKVGHDPHATDICIFQEELQSPSSVAAYIQPQPLGGCAEINKEGSAERDVHIINVHQTSVDPAVDSRSEVVVDVRTVGGFSVQRDLVLVLNGHSKMKWNILTENVDGSLEVLSNGVVTDHVGITMKSVRVSYKRLEDMTTEQLFAWSRQRYGPVVSYTDVQLANKVKLYIRKKAPATAQLKDQVVSPATARSISGSSSSSNPKLLGAVTTTGANYRGGPDMVRDWPKTTVVYPSPFSNPRATKRGLMAAMTVTCSQNAVEVTVKKQGLQNFGIVMPHLSLLDSGCKPNSNSTHYILNTGLTECFTRQVPQNVQKGSPVVYKNALLISRQPQDEIVRQDLQTQSVDAECGNRDGTQKDSDDFINVVFAVEFSCTYAQVGAYQGVGAVPQEINQGNVKGKCIQYSLQMHHTSDFNQGVNILPYYVKPGKAVYVEAKVENEPRLRPIFRSCYVAHKKESESRFQLIDKGCQVAEKMEWIDDIENSAIPMQHGGRRFSFELETKIFKKRPLYLYCELDACKMDSNYPGEDLKMCVGQDQTCISSSIGTKDGEVTRTTEKSPYSKKLHEGPIFLEGDHPIQNDPTQQPFITPRRTPPPSEDREDPQGATQTKESTEQVIVQGLESGTVVCIAFAAFVIGVLLTAALWFIQTHTRHSKRNRPSPPSNRRPPGNGRDSSKGSLESSVECTPNSFTPIAAQSTSSA